MLTAGVVMGVFLLVLGWMPGETLWEMFGFYLLIAFAGVTALFSWRNCIVAPLRMIIDEDGVGGRFYGGGFVGKKRIAWSDITGARFVKRYVNRQTRKYVVLDVNNTGNKYRPARKLLSAITKRDYAFAFDITNSKLSEWQADEIVAVIKNHAKAKPPDNQDSAKSPFAAN